MKQLMKGTLVVLVTLFLFGLSLKVLAGTEAELHKLIDGKSVIYNGVCTIGKKGELVFTPKEAKVTLRCIVGMEQTDVDKHYVLLYVNDAPARLVLYNKQDKSQTTLWTNLKEV